MTFRYLRDPLFIACLVVYAVNRWALKPLFPGGFFHSYLNDLICIPLWVPIMLWGMRRLGVRSNDAPPRWYEILIPLLVWSAVFELLLPAAGAFQPRFYSDPADVFFYTLGALAAALFWRFHYRPSARPLGVTGATTSSATRSRRNPVPGP